MDTKPKATTENLDIAIEQCVIGALLLQWQTAWPQVHKFLGSNCFQDNRHKAFMSVMEGLDRDGLPVDLITVMNRLRLAGSFTTELAAYATECMMKVASSANIVYHSQLVVEHTMVAQAQMELRSAQAGMEIASDKLDAFSKVQERIANIQIKPQAKPMTITEIWAQGLSMALEQNAKDKQDGKRTAGLSTGFPSLDKMVIGLQDGDFTVVAARPAMGKTAFMLSLAISAARQGAGVFIKSLEMPKDQLSMRMLSYLTGVNTIDMRTGQLIPNDFAKMQAAALTLENITISDMARDLKVKGMSPASDVFSIGQEVRDWAESHTGPKLVMLDYLQLVSAAKQTKAGNREQVISETSRELKLLALTEKCPIVTLSQLSREVEKRADKRPMLSDLRESGAIEQDADNVLFLYRPEYYEIPTMDDGSSTSGVGIIITAKQRGGTIGDVNIEFDGVRGWTDSNSPRPEQQQARSFSETSRDGYPF